GPSTERARSIFHSPRIDRTDLAASEALRSCRDRIARKPPDPGRRRKIVVSRLAVIAAQINIGQSAALTEPVCGTVALKQIGECPAYRQSFVPHRREYEDFGDAELFGQHAIEAHVGEDAACDSEVPGGILPQQTPH